MKLKTLMIAGLSIAIFLMMALLPQQDLYSKSLVLFFLMIDVIILLILFFFESERTLLHWLYLFSMALTIIFVSVFRLGETTFATFFLGGLFIIIYLLLIILIALDYDAKFLNKFIDAISVKNKK